MQESYWQDSDADFLVGDILLLNPFATTFDRHQGPNLYYDDTIHDAIHHYNPLIILSVHNY